MIDEIYLDMDGVLTDFDHQIEYYNARKTTGGIDWDKVHKIGASFWTSMPWLLDGHRLYNDVLDLQKQYNFKLGILSAIFTNSGKRGKRYWLEQNCPEINSENIGIGTVNYRDNVDSININGGKIVGKTYGKRQKVRYI